MTSPASSGNRAGPAARRHAAPGTLRLAVCVQLHDANVAHHVRALARHPAVGNVRIVRSAVVPALVGDKVQFDVVPAFPKWKRFAALYRRCRQLVRDGAIDALLSFNPIPYGLIAAAAARGRVPYHLGFIGSDLHGWRQAQTWRCLRPVLRHAAFVTVTGGRMREECQRFGSLPDRTVVLPHTIDVERFLPADPAQADTDFTFIGNLIPLKRVDLILHALAAVHCQYPGARLCVVGDGPCRDALQDLARTLGLRDVVEFTGYLADVVPRLRRSRGLVLASDSEGLPFVVVEAACCGVVPICTRVGTIEDMVVDSRNGLLVPPRDVPALAAAMRRLIEDRGGFERMRAFNLERRETYSDDAATAAWDRWLSTLPHQRAS